MYHYIKGNITEVNLESKYLVLESNNIGYLVSTNLKTLHKAQSYKKQEIKIYIKSAIKEEEMKLYGFMDQASKSVFEIITSVSGIGPKAGMNLLDCLEIQDLIAAVLNDKPKVIATAQGIGLKTAQKLIIEIKNKLSKIATGHSFNSDNANHQASNYGYVCYEEVCSVLANLGYSDIEIDKVLKIATTDAIEDNAELLVRFCIQTLNLI